MENLNNFFYFDKFFYTKKFVINYFGSVLEVPMHLIIFLSFILFFIGFLGLLFNYLNLVYMLIFLEIMLVGVILNFFFFSYCLCDLTGFIFGIVLLSIAGCESIVGLLLILKIYEVTGTVNLKVISMLYD
jgi:NADH:ubiquinone oxidoreductase subunit K